VGIALQRLEAVYLPLTDGLRRLLS